MKLVEPKNTTQCPKTQCNNPKHTTQKLRQHRHLLNATRNRHAMMLKWCFLGRSIFEGLFTCLTWPQFSFHSFRSADSHLIPRTHCAKASMQKGFVSLLRKRSLNKQFASNIFLGFLHANYFGFLATHSFEKRCRQCLHRFSKCVHKSVRHSTYIPNQPQNIPRPKHINETQKHKCYQRSR